MSLENLKITNYEDNVASLPDYPSDAGYTAAQLKAIFDGRTDKEIKEKFNALVDALITKFSQVEVDIADEVEAHNGISDAHSELFSSIHTALGEKVNVSEFDERMDPVEKKAEMNFAEINVLYALLNDKVDKAAGMGLSTNDFTDDWKQSITNAFNEAIYAQTEIDRHQMDTDNPHKVTAEQIGALTSDSLNDEMGNYIPPLENAIGILQEDKADKEDVYTKEETVEVAYNTFVASSDHQELLGDVRILQEQVGAIDAALDSILAIQESIAGGEN